MRIKVLGAHGGEMGGCRSSGFLINGSLLLDAGTTCAALTSSERRQIQAILISHIHLDHTQGLLSLAEVLIGQKRREPVQIVSTERVLAGLRRYFFRDTICPDFTVLPTRQHPVFSFRPILAGEESVLCGLAVRAIEVHHTVPGVGFLIHERQTAPQTTAGARSGPPSAGAPSAGVPSAGASLLYSGDTGPTTQLWEVASRDPDLKAAIIETSFPNALESLAIQSKHLTPRSLAQEFAKINKPDLRLYVYHMKPYYLAQIKREIGKLGIRDVTILREGDSFNV